MTAYVCAIIMEDRNEKGMKHMKRTTRVILLVAVVFAAGVFAALVYGGVIRLNRPSDQDYPVRGVDVSEYQGTIDWTKIAAQGIDFAYVKATEGSSAVDSRFADNFPGAQAAGLRVGAYHFFSFDTPGDMQAANYIANVPAQEDLLPPVIDLEFYGEYQNNPLPADEVWPQLQAALDALEAAYGKKPIIYTTERSYDLYVSGHDAPYDIWIRSTYFSPRVKGWTIWQYTGRGKLDGYDGEEIYIDLNVFNGNEDAFAVY